MHPVVLLKILGGVLMALGLLLFAPAVFSYLDGGRFTVLFFEVGAGVIVLGTGLWLATRHHERELNNRTALAAVTFTWILACLLGALPLYLAGAVPSYVDALFETASGFSGTGASVIADVESLDRTLLLWRSLTQWLGGMGIVVFFLAILPLLGMGGVQLFRAETPGPSKDKITPRIQDTAKNLWLLYLGFTAAEMLGLWAAGMSLFDAVNHSFTTMATGGFSTRNAGIAAYQNPAIDYILIIFMLLGSINFTLHFRLLVRRDAKVFSDTELKTYLLILTAAVALITWRNWSPERYAALSDAFRLSLFAVVSTATTTGYSHADYLQWPVATHAILIFLMVMGGMSGSTSGGMKCIRLAAAFKLIIKDLRQVIHPSAVLGVKINSKPVRPEIANAIWGFMFLYLLIFAVITLILALEGLDIVSGSTAALSALSNVGPAFGRLGPMDNYSALSDISKLALSIGMLLGRLEFFTVILVFTPEYWRR